MDTSFQHTPEDPRGSEVRKGREASREIVPAERPGIGNAPSLSRHPTEIRNESFSASYRDKDGVNQPQQPDKKPLAEIALPGIRIEKEPPQGQQQPNPSSGGNIAPREEPPARLQQYEIPTPREIRKKLRKYVAGCDQLLKDVSIFVHEHLQRGGSYFAVPYVRELLQRNFIFKNPQSQSARELVYAVTRIARNNQITNSKNSRPYRDILGLIQLEKENGEITMRPEVISHRATQEEQQALKKEITGLVRSIASGRSRAVKNEDSYSKSDLKKALTRRFDLPEEGESGYRMFDRWLTRFHNAVRQGDISTSTQGTLHEKVARYMLEERLGKKLIDGKRIVREEKTSSDTLEKLVHRIVKALHQTQKRHRDASPTRLVAGAKESLCIIGDTGTGKTQTIRALEAVMPEHIPIIRLDASTFTEEGYEGSSISELPERLLELTDGDPEMASRAIVFFDEFDKKRHILEGGRDIAGLGVQHALLRVMEDGVDQETGIDFSTVGFIFGGSFQGLDEIVARRLNLNKIGFNPNGVAAFAIKNSTPEERMTLISKATEEDLERYGMAREWVGRVDLTFTEPMGPRQMKIIMEHAQGPYRAAIESLEKDDVRIVVTEEAKELIVAHALAVKKGARGLRTVMKKLTREIRFDAPELKPDVQNELLIDPESVRRILGEPPTRR
jgi:ATP-dependent Clp protease ATP-binding subunit ClpX